MLAKFPPRFVVTSWCALFLLPALIGSSASGVTNRSEANIVSESSTILIKHLGLINNAVLKKNKIEVVGIASIPKRSISRSMAIAAEKEANPSRIWPKIIAAVPIKLSWQAPVAFESVHNLDCWAVVVEAHYPDSLAVHSHTGGLPWTMVFVDAKSGAQKLLLSGFESSI
jgi:hypothetical protein